MWERRFGTHRIGRAERDSRKSIEGSVSLLSLLGMLAILGLAFGSAGLLWNWRHQMSEQLRLDHCVATAAADFRDFLNDLVAANHRIRAIRASMILAEAQPETLPALQAALRLQVVLQDEKLLRWKTRQALWMARQTCGNPHDEMATLPSPDLHRSPPDGLGPNPLEGFERLPERFTISAQHLPRKAVAYVHSFETKQWKASWRARPILD